MSDVRSDDELLEGLRAGDEAAFATFVRRYHAPLLRLAETLTPSRAVAEEVVQDTWLGVVRGIERFEGRSSVKTWLFRILMNRARTAGAREPRSVPLDVRGEPAVASERFGPGGGWAAPLTPWSDDVEDRILAAKAAARVKEFLPELPHNQRAVLVLRDVEGMGSAEVCDLLGLSEGNQRVLLHRARSRVRGLLERELVGD